MVLSSLDHLFSESDLHFCSLFFYGVVFERSASNPFFHLCSGVAVRRIQPGKKREEAFHEPLERAEGRLPFSRIHLGADSCRIVDPRFFTGLEYSPAFPKGPYRIPKNVEHARTEDPIEGLRFEPQAGRVPHFKMDSCGASGPEGIGSGHTDEDAAQIHPDDSDMRRPLHHLNREAARACPEIKEKALTERGKDFLCDLTVVILDDES
jgi:hypothetical protein